MATRVPRSQQHDPIRNKNLKERMKTCKTNKQEKHTSHSCEDSPRDFLKSKLQSKTVEMWGYETINTTVKGRCQNQASKGHIHRRQHTTSTCGSAYCSIKSCWIMSLLKKWPLTACFRNQNHFQLQFYPSVTPAVSQICYLYNIAVVPSMRIQDQGKCFQYDITQRRWYLLFCEPVKN